jgi:hypothetical protein
VRNHHQKIRPTGHEHLEDLGKGEQLATDLIDLLAGARDVNLMGLHVGVSDRVVLLLCIVAHASPAG